MAKKLLQLNENDRAVLEGLAIVTLVPDSVRGLLIDSFRAQEYEFGDEIVHQGDAADDVFVVASGSVRVVSEIGDGSEIQLNRLGVGKLFGEAAVIKGDRRRATVRASGPARILRLDGAFFQTLCKSNPTLEYELERYIERHYLYDLIRSHSEFASLTNESFAKLLISLEDVDVEAGNDIINEGDPSGSMYIIREGQLIAYKDDPPKVLSYLRTGDFFGEISLLTDSPRTASVRALSDCKLLSLSPEVFSDLTNEYVDFKDAIEEKLRRGDYQRVAKIPLDFAQELIPAEFRSENFKLNDSSPDGQKKIAAIATLPEDAPDQDIEAAPEWQYSGKAIRHFPHVWQIDEMDCGAACVVSLTRHYGQLIARDHIRKNVYTTVDGTSLLGLAKGTQEIGFESLPVNVSKSSLPKIRLPAIVHWENDHWVVVYAVTPKKVYVSDPARGLQKYTREEFDKKWNGFTLLVRPTPRLEKQPRDISGVHWLIDLFRSQRKKLIIAVVLALFAATITLALPILSQVIVDDVISGKDKNLLAVIVGAMIVIIIISTVASGFQHYVLSKASRDLDRNGLNFLTTKLFYLPLTYFLSRRTGDITRRLTNLQILREILVMDIVLAVTAIAQLVAALVLMMFYNVFLALVYLLVSPIYYLLMRFAATRLIYMFANLEEAWGKYQSRQIDAVKGIETVKAMAAESALKGHMLKEFSGVSQVVYKADFSLMMYRTLVQSTTFLALALFLFVGALQVINGDLSLGQFVAFNSLVLLANTPILILSQTWDRIQQSRVLLQRLKDVLVQEPEQGKDHSHLRRVASISGDVEIRNLNFDYPGPRPVSVLRDINLKVNAGMVVAIVGRSGSGKTTLIKCLAGLFEPTSGLVLYDGIDLTQLRYGDLRKHIGYVLQESRLFDDTIAANITLGDDEMDFERVKWAAHLANIHEFVSHLPLGYNTRVGETGTRLSGGQRQRISIARALYRRPTILLFDEAMSALDSEAERAIQENLRDMEEGRTTFIIAHRISSVRNADHILVLENGRIVEQGTHDELMLNQGLYFYLTSQQLDL